MDIWNNSPLSAIWKLTPHKHVESYFSCCYRFGKSFQSRKNKAACWLLGVCKQSTRESSGPACGLDFSKLNVGLPGVSPKQCGEVLAGSAVTFLPSSWRVRGDTAQLVTLTYFNLNRKCALGKQSLHPGCGSRWWLGSNRVKEPFRSFWCLPR